MIRSRFWALGLLALSTLRADVTFYSIGPGPYDYPVSFTSITQAGVASTMFNLGDGSLFFNGGLIYRPGDNRFYAIGNDSDGNSRLVSFLAGGGGAYTTVGGPLGQGFRSGLAYDSTHDTLYAISTDSAANSSLNTIDWSGTATSIGNIGIGYYGGLAYANGALYAFSGDAYGVQREFQSIDPTTGTPTFQFELGTGALSFSGGLAYNPENGRFYAIADGASGSTLERFDLLGGGAFTAVGDIGGGFWNVGLAVAPSGGGPTVPEPAAWQLTIVLGVVLAARRRFRRR